MTYKEVLQKIASQENPYEGMSQKQKQKYINKRIKAVPKKIAYQALTDEERLAYMLKALKKSRWIGSIYGTAGFQMQQRHGFQQLDPKTFNELRKRTGGFTFL